MGIRNDRLENMATVLWQMNQGRKTVSEISRITGLSTSTVYHINQYFFKIGICYKFDDLKTVTALINDIKQIRRIKTKPFIWNENLQLEIEKFCKNPSISSLIKLKTRARNFLKNITNNWDNISPNLKEKIRYWMNKIPYRFNDVMSYLDKYISDPISQFIPPPY